MYTIGQVSKFVGMSRSTLLHYDRTGILKPTGRDTSNYRVYTDDDLIKLERICQYRSLGLSLEDISRTINNNEPVLSILNKRLKQIEHEISQLHEQRTIIQKLMNNSGISIKGGINEIGKWKSLFMKLGFSERDVIRWHILFEKSSPDAHQLFLQSLGLSPKDIIRIRNFSSKAKKNITTTHNRREGSKKPPIQRRK